MAEAETPCTIRGIFYRVMSQGRVPTTEPGYRQVQNRVLLMRRRGDLPNGWISDGTRWQVRLRTWSSADRALENIALSYRRALWDDQDLHLEVWSEKDATRTVIASITMELDVPLMVARGFASESFLYETAQAIIADGKHAVTYQLGDHDPRGVAAWEHVHTRPNEFAPSSRLSAWGLGWPCGDGHGTKRPTITVPGVAGRHQQR